MLNRHPSRSRPFGALSILLVHIIAMLANVGCTDNETHRTQVLLTFAAPCEVGEQTLSGHRSPSSASCSLRWVTLQRDSLLPAHMPLFSVLRCSSATLAQDIDERAGTDALPWDGQRTGNWYRVRPTQEGFVRCLRQALCISGTVSRLDHECRRICQVRSQEVPLQTLDTSN